MIDRVSTPIIPIQQRTAANDGVKINQTNSNDNTGSAGQPQAKYPNQPDPKQKEKLNEVIKGLNEFLQPAHTSIQFKLHERLNEYYVTIVDDNTHEVVKEIPAKKLLDIYADMEEHLGILVDKKI